MRLEANTFTDSPASAATRAVRRWPMTIWIGIAILVACEALLFTDVAASHRGALRTQAAFDTLATPHTPILRLARWVAINMTPLAWLGFVIFSEGVLAMQRGGSPVRRRPHHFVSLCLVSIFIWCVFDFINFYFINAWDYIGVPLSFPDRFFGYLLAFGAVVPGMLMSGQMLMNAGAFDWARSGSWRMPRWLKWIALAAGVGMIAWPILSRNPASNYTLWLSLIFLLDPINLKLGRPSMFRDWQNGWYGRTLAACAGGLICGFLWEFWNFWAVAKWIYKLPFLGPTLRYHYFEMPVVGLLGFIPFGMECWVMWQTLRIPLDGMVEGLGDERTLM